MIEMVLVSLLFAVLLVGAAIWRLHEFPESISALVYLLKWPWMWTLWLWIVVLLITPAMIEAVGDGWQSVAFLSASSLLFCGAMPLFLAEHHTAHNILGVTGGVLSQVCVAVISPLWLLVWLLFIPLSAGIWRQTSCKGVFIAEALCSVALYGALLTSWI